MSTRRRSGRIAQNPELEPEEEEEGSPQPTRRKASARKSAAARRKAAREEEEDEEEEEEVEVEEVEEENEEEGENGDNNAQAGSDEEADDGEFTLPKVNIPFTKLATNAVKKMGKEEMRRKVTALVRYLLFCESRRIPVRREDAVKKVFGTGGVSANRAYPYILNRSGKILRKHFGFELVELRARGGENTQITALMGNDLQAQEATQTQKGRKSNGDDEAMEVDDQGEAEGTQKQKKKSESSGKRPPRAF